MSLLKRGYLLTLPTFTGPLDLLLHLIERQELDITAISLVEVTGQYLEQVATLKENKVDQLIDFLVIGARLVLIKSRALLPQTPVIPGSDEEEEDPAEALARQLQAYKQFKQAAAWLAHREEQGYRTYLRVASPPKIESKLDLSGLSPAALLAAVQTALARTEKLEESVSLVQRRTITIEGQIQHLRHTLKASRRIGFHELLSQQVTRVEVSITLLAVLEMIKRREISAYQNIPFGPIEIVSE